MISLEELKKLGQGEGLVLQGCGGDLGEWLDGINKTLTDANILKEGSAFSNVHAFEHEGLTNLVFVMDDDVKLNIGKLAMWRLTTHDSFGGTWLSDYLPNRLGYDPQCHVEEAVPATTPKKPKCPLIGADGNVYNIIALASRALKGNGMATAAKEMSARVMSSDSYDEALSIIMEYVDPVDEQEMNEGTDDLNECHDMDDFEM